MAVPTWISFTALEESQVNRLAFSPGCSKMARCKAPEIPRTEAYFVVRRRDEG